LAWHVEISQTAEKQISKLDRQVQASIIGYLRDRIQPAENPRQFGKASHGEKQGLRRYRVGDYRIIGHIQEEEKKILILVVGHRREVYR